MTDLSKPERRWLDQPWEDDDGRRHKPAGADVRIRKAAERHQTSAAQVAAALISATCTVPPQMRGGRTPGAGRSSDVTDRTLGQIDATITAVDRGLSKLGHLLDRCPACPDSEREEVPPGCNDVSVTTLADLTGESWTWIVDHCVGVSATSPKAVEAAATGVAQAHAASAVLMVQQWRDAWQQGAEADVLERFAHQAHRLSLRVAGLADSLGQWRPGPLVRLCACGCRRPAPPKGEGATRSGCRSRKQRSAG